MEGDGEQIAPWRIPADNLTLEKGEEGRIKMKCFIFLGSRQLPFSLLQPPSVIGAKQISVVNHAVRSFVQSIDQLMLPRKPL